MPFVLDTSVFSALMRGEAIPIRRLVAFDPSEVFVPHPTVAEVRFGLAHLPRSRRRSVLEARAAELFTTLARAPWTDDVSASFGTIKEDLQSRGKRLEDFDIAIAAHALAAGGTLATANVRHMSRIKGLVIEDWTSE